MARKYQPRLRSAVFKHRSTKRNNTRQQAKQNLKKEIKNAE